MVRYRKTRRKFLKNPGYLCFLSYSPRILNKAYRSGQISKSIKIRKFEYSVSEQQEVDVSKKKRTEKL